MPLGVPFDESIGVLFQGRVIAGVSDYGSRRTLALVRSRAARNRARLVARLDTRIITEPAHAIGTSDAPVAIVDPLERPYQRGPREVWTSMQSPGRQAVPPDIGLGERADGGASQAAAPMFVHVGSELVASE